MDVVPLFVEGDLSVTLEAWLAKASRAVDEIPESSFEGGDLQNMANEIFRRFEVAPISLTEGAISVEAEDADIDRRRIRDIDWGFPGDPPTVRGTRVIYNVPFTGEAALLRLKPSTWTSTIPRAVISDAEVRFVYEVSSAEVPSTKKAFDRDLSLTKQWLGWANEQVTVYDDHLRKTIEAAVNQRSSRLQTASDGLAALGLPVRKSPTVKVDAAPLTAEPTASGDAVAGRPRYDVALSFAGEDRTYVQQVAELLVQANANVFYDEFETVELWGKDLIEHLEDIYQNQARFCVLFVSKHYVDKPWPTHERRSAQARALVAKEEYLLPARFDDSKLPGLPPTVAFVDLRKLSAADFADLVLAKIGIRKPEA